MIRAVLDANVLVSAVLVPPGVPGRIYTAWREQRFELICSAAILQEVGRVLRYPRIAGRHGLSNSQVEAFIEEIREFGDLTAGRLHLSVIQEDLSDNRYLECAVEGHAGCIVTGDRHLLNLGHYEGIEIINPRTFSDLLRTLRHK